MHDFSEIIDQHMSTDQTSSVVPSPSCCPRQEQGGQHYSPRGSTERDLIGLGVKEIKSKGVNLWGKRLCETFDNEVRVMPCVLRVCGYESNAWRKVYYMFERISRTKSPREESWL